MTVGEALWGTGLRRFLTTITATATALSAAIASASPVWTQLGFPIPATTAYVQSEIGKILIADRSTRSIVVDVQLSQARDRRLSITNKLLQWRVELEKIADPSTKRAIEQQVIELELEKIDVDILISDLTKRKGN